MRELCPTLDVLSFAMRQLDRGRKLTELQAKKMFIDPVNRSIYLALQARGDGNTTTRNSYLVDKTKSNPNDPRPAFSLLANRSPGMIDLPDASIGKLRSRLDDRYGKLMSAVDALVTNDLGKVYDLDSHLASFGTNEIGYKLSVRMRLVWRLSDTGPEQKQHNAESLDLIAKAAPFLGIDAIVPFRIAAAIAAERPQVAIASAVVSAKSVVLQLTADEKPSLPKMETMRSTRIKCRQMLDDRNAFRSLGQTEYEVATTYIDKVIAGDV
jgi:hypothetical protein